MARPTAEYRDGQFFWRNVFKTPAQMHRLRTELWAFRIEAWAPPLIAAIDAALAAYEADHNMEIAA